MIRLGEVRFYLNREYITHPHTHLHNVNIVSITFKDQKNRKKKETVTQLWTGAKIMRPVSAAVELAKRVWTTNGETANTPLNTL